MTIEWTPEEREHLIITERLAQEALDAFKLWLADEAQLADAMEKMIVKLQPALEASLRHVTETVSEDALEDVAEVFAAKAALVAAIRKCHARSIENLAYLEEAIERHPTPDLGPLNSEAN